MNNYFKINKTNSTHFMRPANLICPRCHSGSYMRYLDELSYLYDVKCINCNSYFKLDELANNDFYDEEYEGND